tara:strand:+ start:967 stop:1125 length:159 start_codon:yes stop_codon:yes gene_type:complete
MNEYRIKQLEDRIERLEKVVETLTKGMHISVNTPLDAKQQTLIPPKQKRLFD